ncbi:MAG TPA: RNA-binding cell elongation regulator Jag/EloR [Coriobacteriia bacterium]|jgi:spoIIIJ-associated protein
MEREMVKEAPTVEEALDAALDEMGVQQDAVEYEVLEEPGKRLFGAGKPARVRVWLKASFVKELERERQDVDEVEEHLPAPHVPAPPVTLSDEEFDRVADAAVSVIQQILDAFGIESSIDEYEGDEGEVILDIVGGELGILIGRHGKSLEALQTLVSAITNKKLGQRYAVLVDVEGYRARRRVKLEEMARQAADRASRQKRSIKLRPMSAYERKVVHVALRNDRRVETASEGEEPFRQVVVTPKR